jgi:hypothetical protein
MAGLIKCPKRKWAPTLMLERIWNLVVDFVTAVLLVMITAIGVIAPLWVRIVIVATLIAALIVRLLRRRHPINARARATVAGGGQWAAGDDVVDATLIARLDATTGSFDPGMASDHPEYVAVYAAARPIERP